MLLNELLSVVPYTVPIKIYDAKTGFGALSDRSYYSLCGLTAKVVGIEVASVGERPRLVITIEPED